MRILARTASLGSLCVALEYVSLRPVHSVLQPCQVPSECPKKVASICCSGVNSDQRFCIVAGRLPLFHSDSECPSNIQARRSESFICIQPIPCQRLLTYANRSKHVASGHFL